MRHTRDARTVSALVTRTLLVLATAALYGLSFPPHGAPLVAYVALVPLLLALRGLSWRAALLAGWLSGLAMAYAITDFLPEAVATYYGQGIVFGGLLFVASVSVMCCLSHMVFAVWWRWPARRDGVLAPLVAGAAWVVAEFVRGDLEGNPWGTLGYTQARLLPLAQLAEWTGVYGVSFLVVASNAALASLLVARGSRRALGGVGVVAALVAATYAWGAARLAAIEAEPGGDVPVAVVQGNVDLGARWQEDLYGRNLEDYLRLTRDAARSDAPLPLAFWPENAVTFFLADEPLYREAIARVLDASDTQLVTGGPYVEPGPPARFYNSAFVITPAGDVAGRYDKRVLMPFAEYYPAWLGWFSRRRFADVREFSVGRPSAPLPTVAGPAAVVTCNEALFPRTVAGRVADGGGYLVNLANDGWLGVHRYSDRVLDMVALRAIEHRRWLIRASSSGGSAIVAPSGRVVASAAPFAAEVLRGAIRSRSDATPYGRAGDLFVALCALVLAASIVRACRR